MGRDVWKENTTIHYSNGYLQAHYYLSNSTNWIPETWSGLTDFDGKYIWKDNDGHIYYSNESVQYELVNGVWVEKDWGTNTPRQGQEVWKDNNGHIYYSLGIVQYELVEA